MRNPIRDWRDRGHVTQRDAAKRLGVSINTLINWETDSAVPDKGHRRVIAGVLGIDLSEVKTWIDKVEGIVTEDVNHE
jgi:transcriptional regulator with XRE-family HTH domain